MSSYIIIPARLASTRLPRKLLLSETGKPLIQHTYESASRAARPSGICVATDHEEILNAVRAFGGRAEMTSPTAASGTDRVAEVARRRPGAELVLNLQGDEPELETAAVERLVEAMQSDPALRMGTVAHHEPDAALLAREDVVKVVVDADGFALYFSRADLAAASRGGPALRHAGVYAFRRDLLLEFASWPPGRLERAERLEQLRALERGVRIRVVLGERPFAGVDTPEQWRALEDRGPRP
jgi:3-deoxy-manno-octulosonate cytidylyltransferase (CMP-KDO synthetase)